VRDEDARIVDQYVHAAESFGDLVDHRSDAVGIRQISVNDNVAVAGQRAVNRIGCSGRRRVVDRDSIAVGRESVGNSRTNPS
jgi:hypothetical protein